MSRVWMITGADRGLGRAFAEEAVKNGEQVIAAVSLLNDGDELMKNMNVFPVIMDVTNKSSVKAAVEYGIQEFGRIDVLINNAGYSGSGAFDETSDEELRDLMEDNYFGVINVMRQVIPVMRRQKGGMILTVSSQAGAIGDFENFAYCSSKYAVVGLSEALRMELAPFGVQVASVLPGFFSIDYRDNSHMQEGDPEKAAAFLYRIIDSGRLPLRILIGRKCCEDAVRFLSESISEIHSYIAPSSNTGFYS